MRLTDWMVWLAATIAANIITMLFSGRSWLSTVLVTLVIIVLFLLSQAVKAGFFTNYLRSLGSRFGPVQANIFGLEWVTCPPGSHGRHCNMHIFQHHVVLVTPDPLGKRKAHFYELSLAEITQVKLSLDSTIAIVTKAAGPPQELKLKSILSHDQLVQPLETLQAELVYERKVQGLRKVTEKAVRIDREMRQKLEERRRVRIEKLHGAKGHDLVERFTAIIPPDIFIKDTLFDKIKELLLLELKGRKSTMQGRLEEFLEDDFKPFAEVMRQKADFDLEDYEDLCLLLQEVRNQVRHNARRSFAGRFEQVLDPAAAAGEAEIIVTYVRNGGPEAANIENLEGLRLYLEERGHHYNFKGLRQKVEAYSPFPG